MSDEANPVDVWVAMWNGEIRKCEFKAGYDALKPPKALVLFHGVPELIETTCMFTTAQAAYRAVAARKTTEALRLLQEAAKTNADADAADKGSLTAGKRPTPTKQPLAR